MAKTAAASAVIIRARVDWLQGALLAALLAICFFLVLYPVARVLWVALADENNRFTLVHFQNFFLRPLFREAL